MPIADDIRLNAKFLSDRSRAAEVSDKFACIVHRIEDYTHLEVDASQKRESPALAELHIFQGIESDLPGRDVLDEIARRLRIAKIATGLSARELAARLGVGESAFSNYCNGTRPPSVYVMMRLSERFGITLEYIYLGSFAGLTMLVAEKIRAAEAQVDQEETQPPKAPEGQKKAKP